MYNNNNIRIMHRKRLWLADGDASFMQIVDIWCWLDKYDRFLAEVTSSAGIFLR